MNVYVCVCVCMCVYVCVCMCMCVCMCVCVCMGLGLGGEGEDDQIRRIARRFENTPQRRGGVRTGWARGPFNAAPSMRHSQIATEVHIGERLL